MQKHQQTEVDELTREIKQYQKTFNDLKTNFNFRGLDFATKTNQKSND